MICMRHAYNYTVINQREDDIHNVTKKGGQDSALNFNSLNFIAWKQNGYNYGNLKSKMCVKKKSNWLRPILLYSPSH